jgi:hypothetical protein
VFGFERLDDVHLRLHAVTAGPRCGSDERFGALFSVEARLIQQSRRGVEPSQGGGESERREESR